MLGSDGRSREAGHEQQHMLGSCAISELEIGILLTDLGRPLTQLPYCSNMLRSSPP